MMGRKLHTGRNRLYWFVHRHIFKALPPVLALDSGEVAEFEQSLLGALGKREISVHSWVDEPLVMDMLMRAGVEGAERQAELSLKKYGVRWEVPLKAMVKVEDDDGVRARDMYRGIGQLWRQWEFTMDVRSIWLRKAEMEWEIQLHPRCTLENLVLWFFGREPRSLEGSQGNGLSYKRYRCCNVQRGFFG